MATTVQDINDDALALRECIDAHHERLVDIFGGIKAEEETNPLYDAVTRLHEWAVRGIQGKEAR